MRERERGGEREREIGGGRDREGEGEREREGGTKCNKSTMHAWEREITSDDSNYSN